MAQPTPYDRLNNFVDYAEDNPANPYNPAEHDAEFDAVEQTLDGVCTNLGLIQRDDGLLANGTVHPNSLSQATRLLISNWVPRGDWVTARDYAVKDFVESGGLGYVAIVAHTSTTFAFDLASGYWMLVDLTTNALGNTSDVALGDALIGVKLVATGSVATTQHQINQETVSIFRFMTAAEIAAYQDNVSFPDVAPFIALAATALTVGAAQGGELILPSGSGKLGSLVTLADNAWIDIVGAGFSTVIKKAYNGDMISLGSGCRLRSVRLQGDGANFTGRGVVVSSGTQSALDKRVILDSWIFDTASYGVEFTQAVAGYSSLIHNTQIIPTTTTVAAVKHPNDAGGGGNRTYSMMWTQSNPIADLGSADNTQIIGCQGSGPILSSTTLKTAIVGCRIPTNAANLWTIDGNSTVVVGNTMAPVAITFASTLVRCKFTGNAIAAGTTITDNAPGVTQNNEIDIPYTLYATTWGAAVAPALVNGTLTAAYSRHGTRARANGTLIAGSSTTFGTGGWTFTVPYTATRSATGTAFFFDSSTSNLYGAICRIASGTSVVKIVAAGSAADFVGATIPFTWATSDELDWEIEFDIN